MLTSSALPESTVLDEGYETKTLPAELVCPSALVKPTTLNLNCGSFPSAEKPWPIS